jgi:hypothetical protein
MSSGKFRGVPESRRVRGGIGTKDRTGLVKGKTRRVRGEVRSLIRKIPEVYRSSNLEVSEEVFWSSE